MKRILFIAVLLITLFADSLFAEWRAAYRYPTLGSINAKVNRNSNITLWNKRNIIQNKFKLGRNKNLIEVNRSNIDSIFEQIGKIETDIETLKETSLRSSSEETALSVYANGIKIGVINLNNSADNSSDVIPNLFEFNKDFLPVIITPTGALRFSNRVIYYIKPDCQGNPHILISEYPVPEDKFLFSPLRGEVIEINESRYYYAPNTAMAYVKSAYSTHMVWGNNTSNCENLNNAAYYYNYLINTDTEEMLTKTTGDTAWPEYCYETPPTFTEPVGILKPEWRQATQEEIDNYIRLSLRKVMIELSPNDPAITGLPNDTFEPPITIEGINNITVIE